MSKMKQTPEEAAMYAARRRERNRIKCARRREKIRDERLQQPAIKGLSKTDPTYRRRLPPGPVLISKSEMRAFLTQAVRNTQGAEA